MTRSLPSRRGKPYRRFLILALTGIILVSLGWAGFKAYRVYTHARAIWATAQQLKSTARQALAQPQDPTQWKDLPPLLGTMEAELTGLRDEIEPFFPLMRRLERLPRYGYEISIAPDLLDAGIASISAGRIGAEQALPMLEALRQPGDSPGDAAQVDVLARVLPYLEAGAPAWRSVGAHLDQASAALQRVDPGRLPPVWGDRLRRARDLLAAGRPLVDLLPHLPDLLGAQGKRAYLIIAQNSDELRATGGFISGAGLVRLIDGRIVDLTFRDSYAVDDLDQPHPPAPEPLRRYMGAELLFLRDANWSPDFPTSARIMQTLYELDQGVATHGVIAFDLIAVQELVGALEPLHVPGVEKPLTRKNVLPQIKAAWEQPAEGLTIERDSREWWRRRKDFMPALVQAAVQRLSGGDVDLQRLGYAFWKAAREKHILIYVNHPEAQAVITTLGWDGGLHPGEQDYLAVFDTNVGYNKVNAVVARQMDYAVTWQENGWTARLTLTYTHPIQIELPSCVHRPEYGRTYADMTRRCYWDYLRVYVPDGSRLLEAEGLDPTSVQEGPGEKGTWEIAGYFVMKPGTEHVVRLTYRLPERIVTRDAYRLTVQKQPGTPAWPFRLTFAGPPGSIWKMEPGTQGTKIRQEGTLRQDRLWEIRRVDQQAP